MYLYRCKKTRDQTYAGDGVVVEGVEARSWHLFYHLSRFLNGNVVPSVPGENTDKNIVFKNNFVSLIEENNWGWSKYYTWELFQQLIGLYLHSGHILMPLLSFWLAVDVARSTRSLRKSNSFSDSMHCFLHSNTTQSFQLYMSLKHF